MGSKITFGIVAVVFAVGLLAFAAGRAAGSRARKGAGAILGANAFTWIVGVGMILAVRSLAGQISGPLLSLDAIVLFGVLAVGTNCGIVSGIAARRPDVGRTKALAYLLFALVFFLGAVITLVTKNAPVFQQVSSLGVLDRQRYEPEKNKACPDNLKSLYIAFTLYVQDWDGLPPAANWLDNEDLTSKVRQNEWLHCPAVSNRADNRYGYAYNDLVAGQKLNGKKLSDLPNAATTPLLYDSTTLEKNAHDAVLSLPRPGRHGGRNNVLYCDGHVEAVAPK